MVVSQTNINIRMIDTDPSIEKHITSFRLLILQRGKHFIVGIAGSKFRFVGIGSGSAGGFSLDVSAVFEQDRYSRLGALRSSRNSRVLEGQGFSAFRRIQIQKTASYLRRLLSFCPENSVTGFLVTERGICHRMSTIFLMSPTYLTPSILLPRVSSNILKALVAP